jgi:2-iminobutanoate/2-iminopropanoate deaminase
MNFVQTSKAPKPLGPYSQGVIANGLVFVSGVGPIDPSTGNVVTGGIREQTEQVIESVKAILEEAGSSLQKVTKVTVFLKDAATLKDMNEVYAGYFRDHKPARTTVIADFTMKDFLVTLDAVAVTE